MTPVTDSTAAKILDVRILAFEGCPNDRDAIDLVRDVANELRIPVTISRVEVSADTAVREKFLGSPTIRIEGTDIEPGACCRSEYGMSCRQYAENDGNRGVPARRLVEAALRRAAAG